MIFRFGRYGLWSSERFFLLENDYIDVINQETEELRQRIPLNKVPEVPEVPNCMRNGSQPLEYRG